MITARYWALASTVVIAGISITETGAQASVLASDDFESYTQGNALTGGAGGSGFAAPWGAPGANITSTVVPGTMMAAGIDGSVNAIEVRGGGNFVGARQFSETLPDIFYVGALFRLNEGDWDFSNTFSIYLSSGPTTTAGALTFGIRNSTAANDPSNPGTMGGGHFMLRTATGSPPNTGAVIPQLVTTGTDYYLVARYSKSGNGTVSDYDTADLWLNPFGPGPTTPEATMTLAVDAGLTSITNIFGRAAVLQTTGAVDAVWFDQLTVGSEWADVVVPEPGAGAIALVSSLGLALRRRRRR